ncbi:hypothetical protein QZL92_18080 [Burkholderia dolosa]|jgi:hypothetical protein|nr:hypothetical protein [Burkholderia dolosa]MDN7422704.1 hypothetical protein [Burkholderia dolosa]
MNPEANRSFGSRHHISAENIMFKPRHSIIAAVLAASVLATGTAVAAQGCGPNGWRGPWGYCRYAAPVYVAPQPVIYPPPPPSNVCPPGYWLGPWGHCRDTPYHGRLPNGTWQ